jgi:hypothetical protein
MPVIKSAARNRRTARRACPRLSHDDVVVAPMISLHFSYAQFEGYAEAVYDSRQLALIDLPDVVQVDCATLVERLSRTRQQAMTGPGAEGGVMEELIGEIQGDWARFRSEAAIDTGSISIDPRRGGFAQHVIDATPIGEQALPWTTHNCQVEAGLAGVSPNATGISIDVVLAVEGRKCEMVANRDIGE